MSSPGRLRVLRHAPSPAAWNMGVDEALLELADAPTLRLYGWQPHAVSLGYFQRFADFADLPAGTTIVRRLTGGGAIHHGDELTFALALDADRLTGDIAASYRLLHDAVIAALAASGVASHLVAAGDGQTARPEQRWCFQTPGRDDIATAHGKLLGSAQRRVQTPRPRLLHHGSLVLTRPALTPFVAAVADSLPLDAAARARLADTVVTQLAAALGLQPIAGELTAAESDRAAALARQRYADPAFVQRR